ncbi:uncharacterized protein ANIA_11330 [Aspergillus nidulans FGSC A4]|uniref:Uncharacterized protein n=1 Tax=Emericella nidulans (strain FGSC A4 / ATCC 38163 / CBS 112.46 / NRRL 194 / M139) TaxID=227321 RepID=C8VMI5_EMENI|nr:hypothetical protein [Aspergillus nidulans FGSC A4]CBF86361.1 TPA: hypothetical protein ANIA_11330 [Aspergillus nidulans FGSC A4]
MFNHARNPWKLDALDCTGQGILIEKQAEEPRPVQVQKNVKEVNLRLLAMLLLRNVDLFLCGDGMRIRVIYPGSPSDDGTQQCTRTQD